MTQVKALRPMEFSGYNAVNGSPLYATRHCWATVTHIDIADGGHYWQVLPASKGIRKPRKKKKPNAQAIDSDNHPPTPSSSRLRPSSSNTNLHDHHSSVLRLQYFSDDMHTDEKNDKDDGFAGFDRVWEAQRPKVSTPPHKKKAAAWPRWKLRIIPCLIRPFLETEEKWCNRQLPTALPTTVVDNAGLCLNEGCNRKLSTMRVQCIDFKDIHHVDFTYCPDNECLGLHEQIVQCGYFPSSPECPHTAFSLDILELFLAMNIRSTLGGSAFRQGIHQLSDVLTWFDVLEHDIELHVNRLLNDDVVEIGRSSDTEGSITDSHPSSTITEEQHSDETEQATDSEADAANLAHA
ncbi:hypothetical protein M422DRAFT_246108 [Sphaerobolus stellatus SS14]|nr:hypothetical protein M422DRAFT_246108 [Sphaerobolus stellatus SS14]